MSKPIFHIGFHKTGTTWFQNYYYPFVKDAMYIDAVKTKDLFIDKGAFEKVDIDKNIAGDSKAIIFCHEELSGNIHSGGMNAFVTTGMAYRIKSIFPDAKIIIFIRNQVDMIASCYSQYVQEGGTYNIHRYLFHKDYKRMWRAPLFSFDHFNYYNIIKLYSSLFGNQNVFIFLYEDFENDIEAFIQNFEKKMGIQSSWVSKTRLNVRYRKGILRLARVRNIFCRNDVLYKYYLCNIPIPGFLRKSNDLLRVLNRSNIFGRSVNSEELLGETMVEYIENYYKKSNNKLSDTYNIDIKR